LTFFNIENLNNNQQISTINYRNIKTCIFYSYMSTYVKSYNTTIPTNPNTYCGTRCVFNNFENNQIKIRDYDLNLEAYTSYLNMTPITTYMTDSLQSSYHKTTQRLYDRNSQNLFSQSYTNLRNNLNKLTYNIFYTYISGNSLDYFLGSDLHDPNPVTGYPIITPPANALNNPPHSGKLFMQNIGGPVPNMCVTIEAQYYVPNILLPPGFEHFIELKSSSKFVKFSDETGILNTNRQSSGFVKYVNNDHYTPHCNMSFVTTGNISENLKIVLQLDGSPRTDCPKPPLNVTWSPYEYASRRIAPGNICCITIHSVPIN